MQEKQTVLNTGGVSAQGGEWLYCYRYTMLRAFVSLSVFCICDTAVLAAEHWTFQSLYDKSDAVVIGHVLSTKQVRNSDTFYTESMQQLESTVRVEAVLKKKTRIGGYLTLVHFQYREGAVIVNGPGTIFFPEAELDSNGFKKTPRFLFFVRMRPDEKVGPVSGHNEPAYSIMQLEIYAALNPVE